MAQSHLLVLNSCHLRFYLVHVQIQSPTESHWTSSLWTATGMQILVSIILHSDSVSFSSSRAATCCCSEDLPTQPAYSSLPICAVYIPQNRSKKITMLQRVTLSFGWYWKLLHYFFDSTYQGMSIAVALIFINYRQDPYQYKNYFIHCHVQFLFKMFPVIN